MSFARKYSQDFQKSLADAEDVADKFRRVYVEETIAINEGHYGKSLPSEKRNQREVNLYPEMNWNYQFVGFTSTHAVFESSYDFEQTTFVRFPIAAVLESEAQREFFVRRRSSYGLGESTEQSEEIQQLLQLQAKYPHLAGNNQ
jgi:hypothetical protein